MIYWKGKFWVWSGTEMEWCIVKVVMMMMMMMMMNWWEKDEMPVTGTHHQQVVEVLWKVHSRDHVRHSGKRRRRPSVPSHKILIDVQVSASRVSPTIVVSNIPGACSHLFSVRLKQLAEANYRSNKRHENKKFKLKIKQKL